MKKLFVFAILSALATTVRAQDESETILKKGDAVPAFTVQMVDGTKVNIADLKGKVVLVNFWATWCPPCRAELQRVQAEIVDRFADEDFVFLPISRGEKLETVTKFREQTGYTFPMGLDPDQGIFKLFAENGIPRNYVIGRDGRIADYEIGYTPELFDEMVASIDKILKTK